MSAFFPVYNAQFTKNLVRQTVAIIQRDIQPALDIVSGVPGRLQGFVEYDLALVPPMNQPQLMVIPRTVTLDQSAEQGLVRQTISLHIGIVLSNQDRNLLAEQVQDYIRALSYVLDTAGSNLGSDQADFYKPLPLVLEHLGGVTTTPLEVGSLLYFRVAAHEYGDLFGPSKRGFLQPAGLAVQVKLIET